MHTCREVYKKTGIVPARLGHGFHLRHLDGADRETCETWFKQHGTVVEACVMSNLQVLLQHERTHARTYARTHTDRCMGQ